MDSTRSTYISLVSDDFSPKQIIQSWIYTDYSMANRDSLVYITENYNLFLLYK